MTDLLFQPSPARGPNDYEVMADDWIVGRIVLSDASPAERPWMWSLDHEFYQGRERTYGYEATREAAMQAFARCCRPPRFRAAPPGGDVQKNRGPQIAAAAAFGFC